MLFDDTTIVRFWAKVDKNGLLWNGTPCWLWTAYLDKDGYGVFSPGHGFYNKLAHRYAYELLVGSIPPELQTDHLCRRRCCVNPQHMEMVTNRVNVLRGVGLSAQNAKKTHCPAGHTYDSANTYVDKRGIRMCRQCAKLKYRTKRTAAGHIVIPRGQLKPTCVQGHFFTEANTYWHNGKRYCKTCKQRSQLNRRRNESCSRLN